MAQKYSAMRQSIEALRVALRELIKRAPVGLRPHLEKADAALREAWVRMEVVTHVAGERDEEIHE